MVSKFGLLSKMLHYMSKYFNLKLKEKYIIIYNFGLDFISASKSCQDIAYTPDCQQKVQNNQCNTMLGNNLPISYYCAKSCGQCSAKLTCNTLYNGCNQGTCVSQNYFNQNSVQCLCPQGTGGAYCQQGAYCQITTIQIIKKT